MAMAMQTHAPKKAIVSCRRCNAILGAKLNEDGSVTPLGTNDRCLCGTDQFIRLR